MPPPRPARDVERQARAPTLRQKQCPLLGCRRILPRRISPSGLERASRSHALASSAKEATDYCLPAAIPLLRPTVAQVLSARSRSSKTDRAAAPVIPPVNGDAATPRHQLPQRLPTNVAGSTSLS